MIKYFQKLKAKKGFTLVELIVVIAIIGVLAAILIPTMLGYVTQSKVTSANSTASSIKNEIDAFLTNCDTNGYGMKKSTQFGTIMKFVITNDSGPKWSYTIVNNTSSFNENGKKWASTGDVTSADAANAATYNAIKAGDDVSKILTLDLKELFPEVKTGLIYAVCAGGKCIGVVYTTETSAVGTDTGFIYKDLEDAHAEGWTTWPAGYKWDDSTVGISKGHIVGTAPVLQVGSTAANAGSNNFSC